MPRTRIDRPHLIAVFILALLLGGCGGFEPAQGGEDIDGPSFVLEIANDAFQDARISVFWNGESQSLGRVRGSTTERFTLPFRGNQIRVRVDFTEGGERYDSNPIELNPDQVVRYRINP